MRLRRRSWQRKMRRAIEQLRMQSRRKLSHLLSVLGGLCLLLWLAGSLMSASEDIEISDSSTPCTPIDVVYTWVNGSDPNFIEAIKQYDPNYDPSRFDDKNELRYSLRSLEKHASWIRFTLR
ncbi:N-acetylglucosamine-1-phosphotransferase subunits alpha/beta [Drosophila madeirensis]|uniref:N-acetylglucosamine-1-phosphotransferase subunits alpha/beta n=1 Tax=Drosophila madeirensis TaxID=30013 RepID=A0AAU9GAU8_DROMD